MRETVKKVRQGSEDRVSSRRAGESDRRIPTAGQVDRLLGDRRETDRRGLAAAMADALSDILRHEI